MHRASLKKKESCPHGLMEQKDRRLSELNEENGDQMKGLCLFSVDCNMEDVKCSPMLIASKSVSLEARVK